MQPNDRMIVFLVCLIKVSAVCMKKEEAVVCGEWKRQIYAVSRTRTRFTLTAEPCLAIRSIRNCGMGGRRA